MKLFFDTLCQEDSSDGIGSDAYPKSLVAKDSMYALESRRVTEGALSINTGANASAEGGGDSDCEDEGESFINLVKAHGLQEVSGLKKKDYKEMQKAYWGKLVKTFKQELADAEEEEDEDAIEEVKAKIAAFKADFDALKEFVKKTIVKNFSEFEFYMADGAELGECMIIPARYIGEATSPVFYYYRAGMYERSQ